MRAARGEIDRRAPRFTDLSRLDDALTVCARLTVAFFFSAFMFLCILLVCGLMRGGGAAEDAEDEAQRSKMRVSASRLALAGAGGGAAPAALATEEEGVFT